MLTQRLGQVVPVTGGTLQKDFKSIKHSNSNSKDKFKLSYEEGVDSLDLTHKIEQKIRSGTFEAVIITTLPLTWF